MSQITVLNKGNVPIGPFTREQVAEKLQSGEFTLNDLAFVDGLTQWTPLRDVLARVDAISPSMPPPVYVPPMSGAPSAPLAYSYAATMQPPPHLVYAGFWLRVAAHLLDNLIVTVVFVFVWFMLVVAIVGLGVFSALVPSHSHDSAAPAAAMIGMVIALYLSLIIGRFLAIWLYHALMESGPNQATWGKRAMGLKVTGMSGQRITFARASGRYFSTLITNMTMLIGYLMVAFTEQKQALHDMIAGTLVVRD